MPRWPTLPRWAQRSPIGGLPCWRAWGRGPKRAPKTYPTRRAAPAALPQSVRTVAQGQRPDGSAVVAQAVWFARAAGPQVRLYHAVVYTAKPRPEVADQFFAGLALP